MTGDPASLSRHKHSALGIKMSRDFTRGQSFSYLQWTGCWRWRVRVMTVMMMMMRCGAQEVKINLSSDWGRVMPGDMRGNMWGVGGVRIPAPDRPSCVITGLLLAEMLVMLVTPRWYYDTGAVWVMLMIPWDCHHHLSSHCSHKTLRLCCCPSFTLETQFWAVLARAAPRVECTSARYFIFPIFSLLCI